MERLQRSTSVLGWNDYRGVLPSWDGTTPGDSFCTGMEQLRGSDSVLVKLLQGCPSVLDWKDPRGVILSWDRIDSLGIPFVMEWNDSS